MKLNRLGRLTMNNPARERLLLGYVGSKLEMIDETPAHRALVIGCGQGTDIAMALGRFKAAEVVAIDIDPLQVERARRRTADPRVTIEIGDALALSAPDDDFDTVFDLGAVHLVPEWETAYAEIARVLRAGGKLRFETIVGRSFRSALRLSTDGFQSPAAGYNEGAVCAALNAVGLACDGGVLFRPKSMVLTGLVGDLIGVATKA